jgi:hypothetical protein
MLDIPNGTDGTAYRVNILTVVPYLNVRAYQMDPSPSKDC